MKTYCVPQIVAISKNNAADFAAELNSTPSRVERSIRHALSQVREPAVLAEFLPRRTSRRGHVTNAEFIAGAVEYLRTEQSVSCCK